MITNSVYDPSKQYYMLDYILVEDCAWVRVPYMSFEEVATRIDWLNYQGIEIKDLRITPESMLDQKREAQYNEEKQEYEKDTITVREYLFDKRYEDMAQHYKQRKENIFATA